MRLFRWRSEEKTQPISTAPEEKETVKEIEKAKEITNERVSKQWNLQMTDFLSKPLDRLWRVGVFLDIQNVYMCVRSVFGHTKINYKALRDFLNQDGVLVKMVAFTCYDSENRAQIDFMHALALIGYRVVAKQVKKMPDGNVKASMDMEMALEILTSSSHMDEIVLVTGDGDFAPIVDHIARMGKIVKVIGPDRLTSPELIRSCDQFINLAQIDNIFSVD